MAEQGAGQKQESWGKQHYILGYKNHEEETTKQWSSRKVGKGWEEGMKSGWDKSNEERRHKYCTEEESPEGLG